MLSSLAFWAQVGQGSIGRRFPLLPTLQMRMDLMPLRLAIFIRRLSACIPPLFHGKREMLVALATHSIFLLKPIAETLNLQELCNAFLTARLLMWEFIFQNSDSFCT